MSINVHKPATHSVLIDLTRRVREIWGQREHSTESVPSEFYWNESGNRGNALTSVAGSQRMTSTGWSDATSNVPIVE